MRKRLLGLALLAGLLPGPPAGAQLVEDYRFKGKVIDGSGKPLADVSINFQMQGTGQRFAFKSKSDGTFDRRMIPHGIYDVTFSKAGYATVKENYDWSPATTETITKEATVTLVSEEDLKKAEMEKAKAEMGKKTSKLYEDAYNALQAGKCDEARAAANEILGIGAGNFEYAVRFVLARCAAIAKDHATAETEYRKVVEMKPDLYEAHFDLAGVLDEQGKTDEAVAEYRRAAELKPAETDARYNAGALLFKAGKHAEARPLFEAVLEVDPNHPQAAKALGFIHISSKEQNLAEASRLLTKYLELQPEAADAAQVQTILKEIEKMAAAKK